MKWLLGGLSLMLALCVFAVILLTIKCNSIQQQLDIVSGEQAKRSRNVQQVDELNSTIRQLLVVYPTDVLKKVESLERKIDDLQRDRDSKN